MKYVKFKYIVVVMLLLSASWSVAQSVKELEQQRKNTLKQLETTSKMLDQTKKSQKSSLNKLTIITRNINERRTLIKNIGVEINELDSEMKRLEQETRLLENRLRALRNDYAKLVQEAYIHRSAYAKIMFVLSAESFDQSIRRVRYLQEYSDYRKQQVAQIEKVKNAIILKTKTLAQHKETKVVVAKQKETEAVKLTVDEKKEKAMLGDLKKREGKLRADLRVQQQKAADINRRIERLIAEEIRKAEEKRKAEEARQRKLAEERRKKEAEKSSAADKKSDKKSDKKTEPTPAAAPVAVEQSPELLKQTREEKLISGNFAANQGRLPWPTDKGFVSGRYGVQPHAVLKHVTTNNKGIYIQTPSGTNARAVFEGVVTQRFSIPGSNNGVIIKHGDYRTVYANLTDIFVNIGDKVTAKQSIGRIYTDKESDNKTELYFQVWKDRSLLNPQSWITN